MGQVSVQEVREMASKLIVAVVVVPFHRRVFDSPVHPLDLAIGPWMVWFGQPIFDDIDMIADQRLSCCDWLAKTRRTARSRTSGEYLFFVLLMMLHPTQELEPPANPARFTVNSSTTRNASTPSKPQDIEPIKCKTL